MMFVVHNKKSRIKNDNWYKLEIIESEKRDMYFLITCQNDGLVGDTCHFSLEEAMTVAQKSFGVAECDWVEVPDDDSQ